MKYASACDGIGAVHLAWKSLGWTCAWIAEIDRFANAVMSHHWSHANLGDITRITEADLERHGTVDLLVGGTPCQSFSVAGLRKGLADSRGNLALRFCQLVDATRPDWVLWENVPGVLSVDGGRAFGTFLGALAELGYGFAYGILDAQYFGVPQRRRRVFVIGYFGDWRPAAAVLFERESLSRHPPPSREARTSVAHTLARGSCGSHGRYYPNGEDYIVLAQNGSDIQIGQQLGALTAGQARQTSGNLIAFDTTQVTSPGNYSQPKPGQPCHPLASGQHPPTVCIPLDMRNAGCDPEKHDKQNRQSVGIGQDADPAPTVDASHVDAIAYGWVGDVTPKIGEEVMPTLRAEQGGEGRGVATTYGVRRLTPRECERLQGFPDDYTRIPWRGKPADQCPDGPRYRVLGNSMAVPVMEWIGRRIAIVDALGKTGEA
jgi:DNA (cytosine-5)-methyltransferase 1